MCDAFLRKEKGKYHALLLGKNGKAIQNQKVEIRAHHRLSKAPVTNDAPEKNLLSRSPTIELCSDKAGEIHLGKLVIYFY
jgi:hypothetical protein